MTKKPLSASLIGGAALAALLTGAAIAAPGPGKDGPPQPPRTRAELQAKIAEHFKKVDTNGDGFVTKAEADAARAKMREAFAERRKAHKEERFAQLDKDKNGSLSKEEYLAPPPPPGADKAGRPDRKGDDRGPGRGFGQHGGHRGPGGPGGMHGGFGPFGWSGEGFDRLDTNKDGKLSLAEVQAGPLAMFDKADTNHDGTISPEEAKAAREAMRKEWRDHRGDRGGPDGRHGPAGPGGPDGPPPPPQD